VLKLKDSEFLYLEEHIELRLDLHTWLGLGLNTIEEKLFIETSLTEGSFGSLNDGF
jgi:hypothetical protein